MAVVRVDLVGILPHSYKFFLGVENDVFGCFQAMQMPPVKPRDTMPGTFKFQEDGSGLGNIMAHPMTARCQIAPRHPLENALMNVSIYLL